MADKVVVDCQSGEQTYEPLTVEEQDELEARRQAEAETDAADDVRTAAAGRLRELYGKGWANLTSAEKAEVPKLVTDLVGAG